MSAPKSGDRALLRATFEEFTRATRSLQAAYDALALRSSAIDRALAETNSRLSSVLDSIPSGVVAMGEDGLVGTVNRAATRILAPALDGAAGRSPRDLVDDSGRSLLALSRRALQETERTLVVAGRTVTVVSRVVRLRGRARRALGSLEILDDVTEVRALADRVRSLDRLASLGEVTAGIAHQIRNPLSGAVGFGGLLRRALSRRLAPDDAAARWLEKLLDGVARADAIVTSTLALARRSPLVLAPVRSGALLAEAAREATKELEESRRAAMTVVAPDPDSGPEILADRAQLKQAILNLARNAFEAMSASESGGGSLRLEAARARGTVVLRVADTGPGVAPSVRARLFQPFATGRASGVGLGLAFARKVVELHGGSIALEPGEKGASFRIDLPASVPAPSGTKAGPRRRRPEALHP